MSYPFTLLSITDILNSIGLIAPILTSAPAAIDSLFPTTRISSDAYLVLRGVGVEPYRFLNGGNSDQFRQGFSTIDQILKLAKNTTAAQLQDVEVILSDLTDAQVSSYIGLSAWSSLYTTWPLNPVIVQASATLKLSLPSLWLLNAWGSFSVGVNLKLLKFRILCLRRAEQLARTIGQQTLDALTPQTFTESQNLQAM